VNFIGKPNPLMMCHALKKLACKRREGIVMRYDELLEAAEKKMKEKGLHEAMTFRGTETGYTRLTNDEFFKTIALKLRTIDTVTADTHTNLFGHELSTPIIAGAMSRSEFGG